MTELHLCNPCRIKQGFKRNKLKCITPQISYCTECKKISPIYSNKHFKKISAPLKDELRDELSTLRNVIKDLKSENEKLKSKLLAAKDAIIFDEKAPQLSADRSTVTVSVICYDRIVKAIN